MFVLLAEEPAEKTDEGPTAITLPSQAKFNVHNIHTLKLLVYRLV